MTAMLSGIRSRSSSEIILACKEVGCPWDPYPATVQDTDYRGQWWWYRKIRCLNCGSLKIEKYAVGDTRFANRIGKPKYDRPPGWYEPEFRFYWSAARELRADRGYLGSVEVPEAAPAPSGNGNGNVFDLRAGTGA